MALEDYKDLVATISGIVTIGQMFSGTVVCKEIYQRGTSSYLPAMTFLPGYIFTVLFWEQARLIKDDNMSLINYIGCVITVVYMSWYYYFNNSEGRREFNKQFLQSTLVVGGLVLYAELEDPLKAEYRYNFILTAIMVVLISLPLLRVPQIIREKNAESIPFPMVSTGVLVSSSWLLYGYIIKKEAIIYQNLFVVVLSLIQVALYLKYPGPGIKKEEKKKE